MGLSPFGNSASSFCKCTYCEPEQKEEEVEVKKKLPNPDPTNWIMNSKIQVGEYLIVEMSYPDCTNYEGRKIMVFKCTEEDLKAQEVVDPHFGEGSLHYPIARFEPSITGWRDACNFARMKAGKINADKLW
jgi:hypothetical protein